MAKKKRRVAPERALRKKASIAQLEKAAIRWCANRRIYGYSSREESDARYALIKIIEARAMFAAL